MRDEPGAKLYFPPFSAQTEARAALSFRENIQRPQLQMNFTINDLLTQILPRMTQFPDNFLLEAATMRLVCLCCHPAVFTRVHTHKKKQVLWPIHTVSDSLWTPFPRIRWWSRDRVKNFVAVAVELWPFNQTPIQKYTAGHHPALGIPLTILHNPVNFCCSIAFDALTTYTQHFFLSSPLPFTSSNLPSLHYEPSTEQLQQQKKLLPRAPRLSQLDIEPN